MAASTLAGYQVVKPVPAAATTGMPRRRRISPRAGRALELLGHAIEYLTDEYVHAGGSFNAHDAQVEAVQLLMAINREVYFECPEVPSLRQRCLSWLHAHAA